MPSPLAVDPLEVLVVVADTTRMLPFDTGVDGELLRRNLQRMGFDMGRVDAGLRLARDA